MFHVVEFTDKKVAVVPAGWVADGLCSWPPYSSRTEVSKAVKTQETPNALWPKYAVVVRCTKGTECQSTFLHS